MALTEAISIAYRSGHSLGRNVLTLFWTEVLLIHAARSPHPAARPIAFSASILKTMKYAKTPRPQHPESFFDVLSCQGS